MLILDIAASSSSGDSLEELAESVESLQEAASKVHDQEAAWLSADAWALLTLRLATPSNLQKGQQNLACDSHDFPYGVCLFKDSERFLLCSEIVWQMKPPSGVPFDICIPGAEGEELEGGADTGCPKEWARLQHLMPKAFQSWQGAFRMSGKAGFCKERASKSLPLALELLALAGMILLQGSMQSFSHFVSFLIAWSTMRQNFLLSAALFRQGRP